MIGFDLGRFLSNSKAKKPSTQIFFSFVYSRWMFFFFVFLCVCVCFKASCNNECNSFVHTRCCRSFWFAPIENYCQCFVFFGVCYFVFPSFFLTSVVLFIDVMTSDSTLFLIPIHFHRELTVGGWSCYFICVDVDIGNLWRRWFIFSTFYYCIIAAMYPIRNDLPVSIIPSFFCHTRFLLGKKKTTTEEIGIVQKVHVTLLQPEKLQFVHGWH